MDQDYSHKTLVEKLGIKPYTKIFIMNPPMDFYDLLGKLPEGIDLRPEMVGSSNLTIYFSKNSEVLAVAFEELSRRLLLGGALWICWPKKNSGLKSDLDENIVRKIGLDCGLVDVKVIKIDEVWSGLKFVRRKEN